MPAVSGQFYPGSASGLSRALLELTREGMERVPAIGVVAPHAGYVYSGAVAGEVFSSVRVPGRAVLFCPNHTGIGEDAAIMSHGAWRMPWGDVPIDEELAARLEADCPLLREDASAHSREHAIEVQLPFLHRFRPDVRIVPIALGRLSLEECRELGEGVADAIAGDADRLEADCPLLREDASAHSREHAIEVQLPFLHRFRPDVRIVPIALGRLSLEECRELGEGVADAIAGDADRPLLVASSDMSHYVPDAVARKKDLLAIDRMLALDPEGLHATVRKERISMCGVLPATVVLFAARRLGAASARLVRYATSGDVSREFDQVVGYAGLAFS